jgi:acyl-CoA synthetase (NDP forming)
VIVWLAARQQTAEARAILQQAGWPVLESPRTGMRVLRALAATTEVASPPALDRVVEAPIVAALGGLPDGVVTEHAAAELLAAAGVEQPEQVLLRSPADASSAASTLTGTFVAKIQSPVVLHKTERGGVRLGVRPEQLSEVYRELCDRFAAEGATDVLVQRMAGQGPELLVGLTRLEPGFPAVLTVGVGGITTELYGDATSRLAPVTRDDAEVLIKGLRGAPLFTGFRGRPGCRLEAAAAAITALSRIAAAAGERLVEMEVNPLRLTDGGSSATALDFVLRLRAHDATPNARTDTKDRR